MRSEALFSEDRRFRYWLLRQWDENLPIICFIGLNPSTADETEDDPTIRREIDFAKRHGFGGLLKLNMYALRSTDPKELDRQRKLGKEIIGGPGNWINCLRGYANGFKCETVVACWGRHGKRRQEDFVLRWHGMKCFGLNSDGTPKHPLYLPKTAELVDFN